MTGDITDAGTRAEWAEFIDLLAAAPSYARGCRWCRVTTTSTSLIAPTRDAWTCRGALASRCASSASCSRLMRWRAIARMSSTGHQGGVGPLLKDYLRQGQRPELLRELANRGTIRGRREMTKVWEAIFPLVSISLRERIGLALINAPDLVAVLAPHSRRVIVLPGHCHRDWIGVCGNIVLCSAPSLGTDSVDKYRGSFRIHQLLAKAGGLQLIATERVRVS